MRPLSAGDLWRLHRVGPAAPMPDGATAVVPVTACPPDEDEPRTRLFRVHASGEPPVPLTADEPGRATQPAPSPDGSRIAYVWKAPGKDEQPQIHVMAADGTDAHRVTDLPLGARDPRWLPDGRRLVCVADLYADAPDPEATRTRRAERAGRATPRVTEDRIYRFWDRWLTDGERPHLFVVDVESGNLLDLTPDGTGWFDFMEPAGQYDISPDGTEVAFAADASEPPHERFRWAIFTVPVTGGPVRCLTPDHPSHARRPRYSPDGRFLVYGIQRRADFYADRVRIARFDREKGEERVLTEDWDRSASGWEVASDGSLVLAAEQRGRQHLWRMALDGGTPVQIAPGGTCAAPRPAQDGSVWYLYDDLVTPPEVRWAPAPGEPARRVTRFDDALLAEIEPFKSTFLVPAWTRHWGFLAWWGILLVAALFWYRPFCRYVCPLGGGLALFNSFRFAGPKRRAFCSRCKICTRGCEPRAIRSDGSIDPRECLSCMECEANYRNDEVCPPLVALRRIERRDGGGTERDRERLPVLRDDARDV